MVPALSGLSLPPGAADGSGAGRLADGRLQGPFQTDGQAIVLEDYLEVRPERRAQVRAVRARGQACRRPLVRAARRVPRLGRIARAQPAPGRARWRALWAAQPSNAGFVCDIFGHNSQMPQIFAGFGIPGGFIWRGLNHIENAPLPLARRRRHRVALLSLWPGRLLQLCRRRCATPSTRSTRSTPSRPITDLEAFLQDGGRAHRGRPDPALRRRRPPGVGPGRLRRCCASACSSPTRATRSSTPRWTPTWPRCCPGRTASRTVLEGELREPGPLPARPSTSSG